MSSDAHEAARVRYENLVKHSRPVLIAYFQGELAERQASLSKCTLQTFEAQKGRCHEIGHILDNLEKIR